MKLNYTFKKPSLRPDITPLIDVIFLLLIFFMITSQLVNNTSIKVELPRVETSSIDNNKSVVISITCDGKFYFGDKPVTLREIDKLLFHMKGMDINIEADRRTSFENVLKVWDIARKYGLKEINISTSK